MESLDEVYVYRRSSKSVPASAMTAPASFHSVISNGLLHQIISFIGPVYWIIFSQLDKEINSQDLKKMFFIHVNEHAKQLAELNNVEFDHTFIEALFGRNTDENVVENTVIAGGFVTKILQGESSGKAIGHVKSPVTDVDIFIGDSDLETQNALFNHMAAVHYVLDTKASSSVNIFIEYFKFHEPDMKIF